VLEDSVGEMPSILHGKNRSHEAERCRFEQQDTVLPRKSRRKSPWRLELGRADAEQHGFVLAKDSCCMTSQKDVQKGMVTEIPTHQVAKESTTSIF
jgi:hypothetical protein